MRALLVLLLFLPAAHAGILNVYFTAATQSGDPGQTLTFSGTLENTTGDIVFINSNSTTFQIGDTGVLTDTPFLTNAPFFLNALETSLPFDFLTVTIPLLQAPGSYTGVITVLGGDSDSAQDIIGTGSFQVDVNAGVPEPASCLLVCGGLGLLIWTRRRLPS